MKKLYIAFVLAFITCLGANAQITDLWITGSAVPGGTQKLKIDPDNQFKFAGSLKTGEMKIMTTETVGDDTKYLKPKYVDSYVVNNGLPYVLTSDASAAGWVITFNEDYYRFTINTSTTVLKGELYKPWHEVFLAGGAVSCGWNSHVMIPMTQDLNDPCVWTWTGELKGGDAEEPRRFKILGQNNWDPKSLHPYIQDEPVLTSTQMRTGGDDTKWEIAGDGIYTITLNTFKETFKAEYLGASLNDGKTTGIKVKKNANVNINMSGNTVRVSGNETLKVTLYGVDSHLIASKSNNDVTLVVPQKGMYIVRATGENTNISKKLLFK